MLFNRIMVIVLIALGVAFFAKIIAKDFEALGDGYDERQKMHRDKGYKYGFYTLLLLIVIGWSNADSLGSLMKPSLVAFILISGGLFTTILYWIWKDAYFLPKKQHLLWGVLNFLSMSLLQVTNLYRTYQYWMEFGQGQSFWEFSENALISVLLLFYFLMFTLCLLFKAGIDKWGSSE
ncbi:hypothetical protein [Streptococcus ovis]|uniref:hypothetical protein n=1 Tax=Streptococcus ovis TaxID=82806 RepID=UPI0003694306|nr:hypothetical protein [Streptococcus ovis]